MKHPLSATRNQLANISNPYQGQARKVLCVCSAGLLRSPTLAHILQNKPYNFNCRAAGCNPDYALVPVTEALIEWADLVISVDEWTTTRLKHTYNDFGLTEADTPILTLDIPDKYDRMAPELISEIENQLNLLKDDLCHTLK